MNWNDPLSKLKILVEATTDWWEGEAKEHKCLRMGPTPLPVRMAYEIKQHIASIERRYNQKINYLKGIKRLAFQIWNTCPTLKHQGLAKDIEKVVAAYFEVDESKYQSEGMETEFLKGDR